jgi:DNA-binding NarL/FixJ family response regulator
VIAIEAKQARVLIADDQTLFRTGLARLLAEDSRVDVVGQAADGAEAVALALKLKPDVVLMDLKMPNVDGIEATRQLVAADPSVNVLILTTFEADNYVIQALKAGARGYVLKDSQASAIVSSIVAVMAGERVMASAVANRVLEMLTGTTTPKEFYDGSLSPTGWRTSRSPSGSRSARRRCAITSATCTRSWASTTARRRCSTPSGRDW